MRASVPVMWRQEVQEQIQPARGNADEGMAISYAAAPQRQLPLMVLVLSDMVSSAVNVVATTMVLLPAFVSYRLSMRNPARALLHSRLGCSCVLPSRQQCALARCVRDHDKCVTMVHFRVSAHTWIPELKYDRDIELRCSDVVAVAASADSDLGRESLPSLAR